MSVVDDCGFVVSGDMLKLCEGPGYLRTDQGGDRLRKMLFDVSLRMNANRMPEFANLCFIGQKALVAAAIESGTAPDLKTTVSPLRMSYAVLVVLGSQRVKPVNPGVVPGGMDYPGTLEILLQHGVDPEVATIVGSTPLHLATALSPLADMIPILLKYGARVDSRNRYGETPLFCAVATNEPGAAELLLKAGADLTIKNADGISPAMIKAHEDVAAVVQKWIRKRAGLPALPFESKTCDHCGQKAGENCRLLPCSRCRTVRYCSKACQRSAWFAAHKHACVSFDGDSSLTFKPFYPPKEAYGSFAAYTRGIPGVSSYEGDMAPRRLEFGVKAKRFPKPMTVKVRLQLPGDATPGGKGWLLVHDKKGDLSAFVRPEDDAEAVRKLRAVVVGRGVEGLVAYFPAELKSPDELVIKAEPIAPQSF